MLIISGSLYFGRVCMAALPLETRNRIVLDNAKIALALERAVERSKTPGAVACVGQGDRIEHLAATGLRQREPEPLPAETNTPYDLASLTKVVATTTAALKLWEAGALSLDDAVTRYLPDTAYAGITLRQLLTHTAGFPAYDDLYREANGAGAMLKAIAALPRSGTPARRVYSDFGYMLLGKIIAQAAGASLDAFCGREIFAPLGMRDTAFNPPPALAARAAATERCTWRGRLLAGEAHDENAAAMGGVSGHAGLFSSAPDLALFCAALLGGKLLKEETLDAMLRPEQVKGYPWQGLGWKLDGWMDSNEGYLPSRKSFGHTGWTGTSLWLDRETQRYAILLSNTCHPSRERRNNPALRKTFHIPMARWWYPPRTNAHTGLDRLRVEGFDALRGKRIGLLTNHAAVDARGRHILDLLREAAGVSLRRLFSPEHGLRGQAEAGARVEDEGGTVPVISLYGQRSAPSAQELAGLDHFVIDLPDVGARYYTYAATTHACVKACNAAGVAVSILDRPNPLGGVVLEGPVAERHDSLVCAAPVPVRHGMTQGEMALFMHARLAAGGPPPGIIRADNWPRELTGYAASLPWMAPSPNITDLDSALLYVGNCLFEGVNLNEGRGTYRAFSLCGAPWLDPEAVLDALDTRHAIGVELRPEDYAPSAIPGRATAPAYLGETCRGLAFTLRDRATARPFMLAVALLAAIRRVHGAALQFKPFFDTLAGGPWLRAQLESDAPLDAVTAACEAQHRAYRAAKVELYPDSDALIRQYTQ